MRLDTLRRTRFTLTTIAIVCTIGLITSISRTTRVGRGSALDFTLQSGRLYFSSHNPRDMQFSKPPDFVEISSPHSIDGDSLKFDYQSYPTWWFIAIPLWVPALVPGAIAFGMWLTARRHHGLSGCSSCGYPCVGWKGKRCPECGANEG